MWWLFLLTALSTFTGGMLFGPWGLIVTIGSILALTAAWLVVRQWLVTVPVRQAGIVFHAVTGQFLRFLPPGRHWIKPFVERLGDIILTEPGTLYGTSREVQAGGGIPLTISWSLSYSLDPWRIAPQNAASLAYSLPGKTAVLATRHMDNLLQHILNDISVAELILPGAHRRLERQATQQAMARLAPLGFVVSQVMIGAVELPAQVKNALEAAEERRLRADNEALALARLQQTVSQFSEVTMQRLLELERIYRLGQNGVTLWYTAVADPHITSPIQPPVTRRPVTDGHSFAMSAH